MDIWKIVLIVGIVLLVAVASWALLQRRRGVWQRFARRHRLRYSETKDGPRAEGTIEGFHFELRRAESSDSGPLGVEEVWMEVQVNSPLPEGVKLERAGRVEHAVRDMTAGETLATNDEFFDQHFIVETDDTERALNYLTASRRQALAPLAELPTSCHVGLAGAHLYCCDREMVASLDRLEHRCELLCRVARQLDTAQPSRATPA